MSYPGEKIPRVTAAGG